MRRRIWVYFLSCTTFFCCGFVEWGFFGHRQINELAVFTLPPKMIRFYKKNIDYLIEYAVAPDRRRYAIKEEAPRHYIDLDLYDNDSARSLPKYWQEAVQRLGKDTLESKGIVPWHIYRMYYRLRESFLLHDPERILRNTAELGHYISDANVPLHTTSNYNGQLTGQVGIHALWESRLPELFFDDYDFFVGKASYIVDVQSRAWRAVNNAHRAVDSVLQFEKELSKKWGDKKYNFETRGKKTVKTTSLRYSTRYHKMLSGMVERQMRASIKMTGDVWYTAWVDAGQPNLDSLITYRPSQEELEKRKKEWQKWRTQPIKSSVYGDDTGHE